MGSPSAWWRAVRLAGAVAASVVLAACSLLNAQPSGGSSPPPPAAATTAGGAPTGSGPSIAVPTGAEPPPGQPSFTLGPPTVPPATSGPTSTPTSRPTKSPTKKPAKPAREVAAFVTPSRNIVCGRIPGGQGGQPEIACQVFLRDFRKPACRSREVSTSLVAYLTTTHKPTAIPCSSDVAVPEQPVGAAYGDRFAFDGGTSCTVVTAHVRCVNRAAHGFELSRQAYVTF